MNLPNPPMAESAGLREIKSYLSVLSAELRRILLNLDESNLSAEALSRLKASFSKADAASKLLNRFTARGDLTGKASGITGILPLENGGTGASDDADARANLGLADTGFQNAELCPGVTVPAGSAVGWRRIGNHVFAQAHPVFSYSASQIAIASGFPAPPRDLCFLFIATDAERPAERDLGLQPDRSLFSDNRHSGLDLDDL